MQIYKLYRQQQNARRNWAKTLWCNLNASTLTEGIHNYLAEFHKFPRAVQEIPAGRMLQKKMQDFRDSVPIILQLQDAASLRGRHWQHLMGATGKAFDWSADGTFLLREIFEMELHRFKVGDRRWRGACVSEIMISFRFFSCLLSVAAAAPLRTRWGE